MPCEGAAKPSRRTRDAAARAAQHNAHRPIPHLAPLLANHALHDELVSRPALPRQDALHLVRNLPCKLRRRVVVILLHGRGGTRHAHHWDSQASSALVKRCRSWRLVCVRLRSKHTRRVVQPALAWPFSLSTMTCFITSRARFSLNLHGDGSKRRNESTPCYRASIRPAHGRPRDAWLGERAQACRALAFCSELAPWGSPPLLLTWCHTMPPGRHPKDALRAPSACATFRAMGPALLSCCLRETHGRRRERQVNIMKRKDNSGFAHGGAGRVSAAKTGA